MIARRMGAKIQRRRTLRDSTRLEPETPRRGVVLRGISESTDHTGDRIRQSSDGSDLR